MLAPAGAILTNLIVFTAIFEFFNAITLWLFSLVNVTNFGLSVKLNLLKVKLNKYTRLFQ